MKVFGDYIDDGTIPRSLVYFDINCPKCHKRVYKIYSEAINNNAPPYVLFNMQGDHDYFSTEFAVQCGNCGTDIALHLEGWAVVMEKEGGN